MWLYKKLIHHDYLVGCKFEIGQREVNACMTIVCVDLDTNTQSSYVTSGVCYITLSYQRLALNYQIKLYLYTNIVQIIIILVVDNLLVAGI